MLFKVAQSQAPQRKIFICSLDIPLVPPMRCGWPWSPWTMDYVLCGTPKARHTVSYIVIVTHWWADGANSLSGLNCLMASYISWGIQDRCFENIHETLGYQGQTLNYSLASWGNKPLIFMFSKNSEAGVATRHHSSPLSNVSLPLPDSHGQHTLVLHVSQTQRSGWGEGSLSKECLPRHSEMQHTHWLSNKPSSSIYPLILMRWRPDLQNPWLRLVSSFEHNWKIKGHWDSA